MTYAITSALSRIVRLQLTFVNFKSAHSFADLTIIKLLAAMRLRLRQLPSYTLPLNVTSTGQWPGDQEDLDEWRNGPYGWVIAGGKPYERSSGATRFNMNGYKTLTSYSGPYLRYVRTLSGHWDHLQLLADFMDAGTVPMRWLPGTPGGYSLDISRRGK